MLVYKSAYDVYKNHIFYKEAEVCNVICTHLKHTHTHLNMEFAFVLAVYDLS